MGLALLVGVQIMNLVQKIFVAAIVCNDTVSTDDDLIKHFIDCQLTKEEATHAVALRHKILQYSISHCVPVDFRPVKDKSFLDPHRPLNADGVFSS